jgi:hypothetical protein
MPLRGAAVGSAAALALPWGSDMAIHLHYQSGGQMPPPLRVVAAMDLSRQLDTC